MMGFWADEHVISLLLTMNLPRQFPRLNQFPWERRLLQTLPFYFRIWKHLD